MTRIKTILARLPTVYRHQKGQSLVEFAIVLPLLLGLVLGIVQFGIIFVGQITITSVAREGARLLSQGRSYEAVFAEIESTARSYFLTIDTESIEFYVHEYEDEEGDWDNTFYPGSEGFDFEEYSDAKPAYLTHVSVTIPASVEVIVPLLPMAYGEEFNIKTEASMRYQVQPLTATE